jgi:hypothetical protein
MILPKLVKFFSMLVLLVGFATAADGIFAKADTETV